MEQASQLGIYGLYRLTVVTFADVAIDMGWAAYAVDLIDEIYGRVSRVLAPGTRVPAELEHAPDQVLTSTDEELKGYASLTKARALIVRSLEDPDRSEFRPEAVLTTAPPLTSPPLRPGRPPSPLP